MLACAFFGRYFGGQVKFSSPTPFFLDGFHHCETHFHILLHAEQDSQDGCPKKPAPSSPGCVPSSPHCCSRLLPPEYLLAVALPKGLR